MNGLKRKLTLKPELVYYNSSYKHELHQGLLWRLWRRRGSGDAAAAYDDDNEEEEEEEEVVEEMEEDVEEEEV